MKNSFETAQQLGKYGFRVFPIKPGCKSPPLWHDWPNRATKAPDRATWPEGANVGIHCEHMVVVDIDFKKPEAAESLLRLEMDHDALPASLEAVTATGGRHVFYALPEGHPGVPNKANVLGDGIDVRSTNGYVVAAGSVTEKGEYKWHRLQRVAPAPEWLVQKLGTATIGVRKEKVDIPDAPESVWDRALQWLRTAPRSVKGAGGDETAYKVACQLRDFGVSEQQACELMRSDAWDYGCGWRAGFLESKPIASAYRYAKGEPGAKAVRAEDFPIVPEAEAAPEPAQRPKPRAIRMKDFASGAVDSPYLIKGLLPAGVYAEVFGESGAGKTFVALDWAYHVARGRPWHGQRVTKGLALYLAYEGAGGLKNRVIALQKQYGDEDVPFYFVSADFNIRDAQGARDLRDVISSLPERPALIVFDTLAHALCGGDENSAQDTSEFNRAAQLLIQATGATVLVIHHSGKDKSRGSRGSSAIPAAVDTQICIDDNVIKPTKQRDIDPNVRFGFTLQTTMIGADKDNEPIMTCIVVQREVSQKGEQLKRGSHQDIALDALCELAPDNEPVSIKEWRAACLQDMTGKRFSDAKRRLKDSRIIKLDLRLKTVERVLE